MQQKTDKWTKVEGMEPGAPSLLENGKTDAKRKLLGTVLFPPPPPPSFSPSPSLPIPLLHKKRPGKVSLIIPKGLVWTSEPRMQHY